MALRTRSLAILAVVALLASGCDNSGLLLGPDGFERYPIDSSGLRTGQLLSPYQGALRLGGYDGPVTWTLTGGDLPPGLGLLRDGTVSGTPTWVGQFSFEVTVTDRGSTAVTGPVSMRVVGVGAPVHLGWVHDQTTRLTSTQGLMLDLWVRAAGGGERMSTYTLDPGVYLVGLNGTAEAGFGDDVRVGDLGAEEVEITLGQWEASADETNPPHEPEGSPPTFDGALTFQAGADTGEVPVTIESLYGTEETRLMVLPPDWCTQGRDGFDGWCL